MCGGYVFIVVCIRDMKYFSPIANIEPQNEKSQRTQPSNNHQIDHYATRHNHHALLLAIHLKISGAAVAAEQAPRGKNQKIATKLPTRRCEIKRKNYKETGISSKFKRHNLLYDLIMI